MVEWVLAAYLGAAHTQRTTLTFSQDSARTLTLPSVSFRGESWSSPLYYGYRVACFRRRTAAIGVEGEFTHLKVYANLPAGSRVQRFSMSHGLNLVLANVVVRKTLRDSSREAVRLTGHAGAGPTVPHVESTIDGVAAERYQFASLALHASAGVEVAIRPHVSTFAEYKLTRTHEHVDVAAGDVRGLFVSHHAVLGIAWHAR